MTKLIATKKEYFSIQSNPFEAGEVLCFDLFVVKEKRTHLLYSANKILGDEQWQALKNAVKIYMKQEDFRAFQQYYYNKKAPKRHAYEHVSFESITESLKSYLRHIFTNAVDAKNVQKLSPLVSHLATLIINDNATVGKLIHLIEKDYQTYSHSLNVAIYAALLGKEIMMEKSELKHLILSAMLHDVGKTKIDEKILYKKEALTAHELKVVKMHATMGFIVAKNAGITDKQILSGIHHHHERLDGSGYPNGFKGDHVSKFARIIAICDTYAAMSSNRVHQASKKPFEILTEMKTELRGKLDESLINSFIRVLT